MQIELTKEFLPELEDFTKELEEMSDGQSRVYLVYAKYAPYLKLTIYILTA